MPDLPTQANEALEEQKEWLRVTLSSIGDGVITTDGKGLVTFLNPVAQALTGWSTEESAGLPLDRVFQIVNEESRQAAESPAKRVLRDGLVVGMTNHTLLIAKDGTEWPIDDSAAPIRTVAGELAGVVLVFRDITERRRQERLAQEALDYADNIIATMREPFVVLEGNLKVRTANRSFYETFQVTPEETQGRLLYELGDGQWNIPRLRVLLEDVLPADQVFDNFEVEHTFPAIGPKWMMLNARRIRRPGNDSELILLAIEDITDRKKAEVEMQVSEVRYRRLFETARDGILILDADTGKILDANPYMAELLGYGRHEFIGKELWEIGVFGDRAANEAAFKELQQSGFIRYEHLPLQTRTGQSTEVEFVSNVYHVDRHPIAQCNIRDIRDRVRLEQQSTKQAADLSDLHRRKDEFLAMLSHELRSPLAPISNAVHMLRIQRGNENPVETQARAIIERQVEQLRHLVDDLLEVSRITTGRVRLHQEQIALGGIVERGVETANPVIQQHGHVLTISVPENPIWLYADAARIEQVIVNLLTNAAKYTDDGGHLWLTVTQEGETAVLSVRDTGVGIAPELLPRIFELFTQAERSLDRAQGGLGIGLSLVQRIVELHGGTVEAVSVLGRGSEFVARLPVMTPAMLASVSLPPEALLRDSVRRRVLVVDDNVDSAESLAMLLRAIQHDVRTAYDGPTAVIAALDFLPEVVMLDIGLPGLSGHEVARRLRREPGLKGTVIVAMTGYGQDSDRERSREAGFDHHLVKPAEFDKVRDIFAAIPTKAS